MPLKHAGGIQWCSVSCCWVAFSSSCCSVWSATTPCRYWIPSRWKPCAVRFNRLRKPSISPYHPIRSPRIWIRCEFICRNWSPVMNTASIISRCWTNQTTPWFRRSQHRQAGRTRIWIWISSYPPALSTSDSPSCCRITRSAACATACRRHWLIQPISACSMKTWFW